MHFLAFMKAITKPMFALAFIGLLCIGIPLKTQAHPMPNSLVLLNILHDRVRAELRLPLQEFVLAFPQMNIDINEEQLPSLRTELSTYFAKHIAIQFSNQAKQNLQLSEIHIEKASNSLNGNYRELVVTLESPMRESIPRQWVLHYDAIIHQVVSHFAIVRIQQDFNNGIVATDPIELGVIQLDLASNTVKPLSISLEEGSVWKGFKKMFLLGMEHIRHGIDHVMYLWVVLIVAPLKREKYRWGAYGGHSYATKRVLSLITAFSIGHSLSLIVVAFNPMPPIIKTVEIGIGISIMLAAIHAWRPIFQDKELLLTLFFGLIHGAAFASSLFELYLPLKDRLLSVLGFNLGIEAMQLIAVLIFIPLWLMSKTKSFDRIRISIAIISFIASAAWIIERISERPNIISAWLNGV